MVASKAISEPLELVSFRVIRLSTLASVRAVSSVFLTGSSKVMVMFESAETPVAEFAGLNVTVGEETSTTSKPVVNVYS